MLIGGPSVFCWDTVGICLVQLRSAHPSTAEGDTFTYVVWMTDLRPREEVTCPCSQPGWLLVLVVVVVGKGRRALRSIFL